MNGDSIPKQALQNPQTRIQYMTSQMTGTSLTNVEDLEIVASWVAIAVRCAKHETVSLLLVSCLQATTKHQEGEEKERLEGLTHTTNESTVRGRLFDK